MNPVSSPSVSLVVVNFNGEHYLPGTLQALRATEYPFLEWLCVDDASTDGSRLLLRHRFPEVRVLPTSRNGGPAAARNLGLEAAVGDLVLFVDNDARPRPDCVANLVAAFRSDPELVAAVPRIILSTDPPRIHADGARTHFTGQMWLLHGHRIASEVPERDDPISSIITATALIRRDAARSIGGFDPAYFIYYEDHDLGTRLSLAGGRLASIPAARVDHLEGTADLSFRDGRYRPRRVFYTARGRILFILRTFQPRSLLLLAPALLLHEAAQALFVCLRGWLEPYSQALFWHVSHLSRTLRGRADVQDRRRMGDGGLLQDGPLPIHPGLVAETGVAAWVRRALERVLHVYYHRVKGRLGR